MRNGQEANQSEAVRLFIYNAKQIINALPHGVGGVAHGIEREVRELACAAERLGLEPPIFMETVPFPPGIEQGLGQKCWEGRYIIRFPGREQSGPSVAAGIPAVEMLLEAQQEAIAALKQWITYVETFHAEVVTEAAQSAEAPTDHPSIALISVLSNGVSDDRIKEASGVVTDATLTANEKLTKIHRLVPFPPTASAQQLGDMLGVTKQAVMKTEWWVQNRKGEKDNEIGRRRDVHQKRAKEHEWPNAQDDDD